MIFTLFAILTGLWAIIKFKQEGKVSWVFVFLTIILLGVEVHFFILKGEIAQYYWASGTAGSGITYSYCSSDDGYGNCLTWKYSTYLDYKDTAVGDYIAYRKMESTAMSILFIPLGFSIFVGLASIVIDLIKRTGLLPRRF